MLIRYAQHLAQGHGIVYNIDEPPVDGATDFLYLMILAGLIKLGLAAHHACIALGSLAHIMTVLVVYIANRHVHRSSTTAAFVSAGYLALGPGLSYTEASFGTTVFTFFLALMWWGALLLLSGRATRPCEIGFACSGLLAGLTRPEGVIVSGFILLAVVLSRGVRQCVRLLIVFAIVFAVIGGAYFAWRWQYFGQPLPNPFYVKGQQVLYPASLIVAIRNVTRFALPFLAIMLPLGCRSKLLLKYTAITLLPVFGFTAMWMLLSNEMNYMGRFQYPILPVILMSWAPCAAGIYGTYIKNTVHLMDSRMRSSCLVCFLLLASTFFYTRARAIAGTPPSTRQQGLALVAHKLSAFAGHGYTLATTEAGLLPLYSRWRSIDAYGLNNHWIARQGGITPDYLSSMDPELIVFHDTWPQRGDPAAQGWFRMLGILENYVHENDFVLVAAFAGDRRHIHYYYLKADCPDYDILYNLIGSVRYYIADREAIDISPLISGNRQTPSMP
ncbi:MAG: hypothetical protein GXY38_07810 [Planctomycetes bacterium]|nr:hypothetical protein [Planctomycetota bacterium]